jgi:hypothetical protein
MSVLQALQVRITYVLKVSSRLLFRGRFSTSVSQGSADAIHQLRGRAD